MSEQVSADQNAELEAACFELARTAKWVQKPIDSEEIRDLGARFAQIAKSNMGDALQIDAPLLTRAVRYLTQAHGMPMGDDTSWFSVMLRALVEVARPNSGPDECGQEFLEDMREGIDSLLNAD